MVSVVAVTACLQSDSGPDDLYAALVLGLNMGPD